MDEGGEATDRAGAGLAREASRVFSSLFLNWITEKLMLSPLCAHYLYIPIGCHLWSKFEEESYHGSPLK